MNADVIKLQILQVQFLFVSTDSFADPQNYVKLWGWSSETTRGNIYEIFQQQWL